MVLSSKKVVISSDGLDWTQNLLQSHHHHQAILDHQLPKQQPLIRRQQNQQNQSEPLKCPRCDSSNTKFCYYNNYNKSQPRHFCKSCKRHWTKGGTLRNVPVGGGRKNKRHKSSSKTTTTIAAEAAARTSTNHNVSIINRVNSHLPLPLGGQKNLSEILYRAGLISPTSASASSSSAFQQNSISNNSNGVIFGSNLSLPQTQDQGLSFPFPNPFQSSEFCEYTGEPLENSTITTTSSTITLPWQAPNTNFWNWDDIDNLVSTADLNIPWNDDDPEIKP